MSRKKRPITEKAALTLFMDTWRNTQAWIPTEPTTKSALSAVIAACDSRLREIERENKKAQTEAANWENKYRTKKNEEIVVTHRKSSFSGWLTRLQGSAFKPK